MVEKRVSRFQRERHRADVDLLQVIVGKCQCCIGPHGSGRGINRTGVPAPDIGYQPVHAHGPRNDVGVQHRRVIFCDTARVGIGGCSARLAKQTCDKLKSMLWHQSRKAGDQAADTTWHPCRTRNVPRYAIIMISSKQLVRPIAGENDGKMRRSEPRNRQNRKR